MQDDVIERQKEHVILLSLGEVNVFKLGSTKEGSHTFKLEYTSFEEPESDLQIRMQLLLTFNRCSFSFNQALISFLTTNLS